MCLSCLLSGAEQVVWSVLQNQNCQVKGLKTYKVSYKILRGFVVLRRDTELGGNSL